MNNTDFKARAIETLIDANNASEYTKDRPTMSVLVVCATALVYAVLAVARAIEERP